MCGIIAAASSILSVAGGVVGAVSSVKQGNAQRDAAYANAAANEAEARDRLQQASRDAGDIAAQGAAIAATQHAASASSNVSGGTTQAAELESNINAARDEATMKSNAARQAWGLQRQAASLRKQGDAAHSAGVLGAYGSAIGGLAQAGGTASLMAKT